MALLLIHFFIASSAFFSVAWNLERYLTFPEQSVRIFLYFILPSFEWVLCFKYPINITSQKAVVKQKELFFNGRESSGLDVPNATADFDADGQFVVANGAYAFFGGAGAVFFECGDAGALQTPVDDGAGHCSVLGVSVGFVTVTGGDALDALDVSVADEELFHRDAGLTEDRNSLRASAVL